MTKQEYGNYYKVKVGGVLQGLRTMNVYDVIEHRMTSWPGHGIYTLLCRETKEKRTIADFALYRKYNVISKITE